MHLERLEQLGNRSGGPGSDRSPDLGERRRRRFAARRAQLRARQRSIVDSPIMIRPGRDRAPLRPWPSSASPTVALARTRLADQPDTSPGAIDRLIKSTMSGRARADLDPQILNLDRRPVAHRSAPPVNSGRDASEPVADQSHPHGQQPDRNCRGQRRPRLERQCGCVLGDHGAPVRRVRASRQAEEGESRDQLNSVGEPERRLDGKRADNIRQDLDAHDPRPAVADRACC